MGQIHTGPMSRRWLVPNLLLRQSFRSACRTGLVLCGKSFFQKEIIKKWGAIPAVNSRTHTHCARAASQALQSGGLPINSAFNQMDDGGQIFPKTLHTILSRLAGVQQRNLKGYSSEPHDWSVRQTQGCPIPVAPPTISQAKKR
jgi:hypothetical protein